MRVTFPLLLLLAISGPAAAQANPDSVKHRNDCRLAVRAIETGRPAPHLPWALAYVGTCGASVRGAAHAVAVRRLRSVADTATLGTFWRPTHYLLDRNLYDAALDIAADPSASVESRVFAFLTLVRYSIPPDRAASYASLTGGFYEVEGLRGVAGGCAPGVLSDGGRQTGVPLPPDFRLQIREVGESVLRASANPLDVRTAASCAVSVSTPRNTESPP